MGEVTRCGILKKYDGVPFTSQLGTVLMERVVDVLFLLVLLAAVLFLNWDILSSFFQVNRIDVNDKISILQSPWFIGAMGIILSTLVGGFLFRKRLMKLPLVQKFISYFGKFSEGLKSVFRLRQPIAFILLTIAIYGCYYLSTVFVFKAFAPTTPLSLMAALSVLALGSIGMIMPVPNGIGPFDWIAVNTLLLYKVAGPDAQLVTLVMHGSTTLFVIVCGAIALGLLPILNRNKQPV